MLCTTRPAVGRTNANRAHCQGYDKMDGYAKNMKMGNNVRMVLRSANANRRKAAFEAKYPKHPLD